MFEMRAEYSMRRLVAVLAGANVRFTNKTFRELVGNMLRAENSNIGGVVGSRHFPMAKRTLKELMRNLLRATDSVRILVVVNVAITLANNAMAGASGGFVVGKKSDDDICCDVGRGHLAVANMAWRELMIIMLWVTISIRILIALLVGASLRWPVWPISRTWQEVM